MKGIILAAGKGTRIAQITKKKPKCLIKLNKKKNFGKPNQLFKMAKCQRYSCYKRL